MKRTAGKWDWNEWPIYFLPVNTWAFKNADTIGAEGSMLIATNELMGEANTKRFEGMLDQGKRVLLDSGVYWLATQHAARHEMTMDEALSLAPDEVDNWQMLLSLYIATVKAYESHLWGYIELDQGGISNKKKTRAYLEGLGLQPIPVYHPLNDGWDYFDELASNYERICVGNIVRANRETRTRILATIWERKRKYPHLWVHALGMTPNDMTLAYMMNSFDSSSWLHGVMYGMTKAATVNSPMTELKDGFQYRRDVPIDADTGHTKAFVMCGYSARMLNRSLAQFRRDMEQELGADMGLFDDHHG